MVFRVFQGIGFGAEWGVGAVLVAELVRPESRGRGAGDHPERVGRGLGAGRDRLPDHVRAVLRGHGVARAHVPRHPAGAADPLRALAASRTRRSTASRASEARRRGAAEADPQRQAAEDDGLRLAARNRHPGRLLRDVHLDPDVPEDRARPHGRRHERVPVRGHRGRVPRLLDGGLGARPDRAAEGVRAVRGAGGHVAGRVLPGAVGLQTTLLLVGFPLGFFASGCFSGFGSYLAELFPTQARATGEGFCYNVGRGFGALFPGIIGFLAAAVGLGGAIAFGVFGYVLAIAALAMLPETQGREIRADRVIDALLSARVYDLEQPRYAGAPIIPRTSPGGADAAPPP